MEHPAAKSYPAAPGGSTASAARRQGAIGIFDSGVGGLTVYRQVTELLPGESVVYLGDTARVPYGTKSGDTVIRYARACARLLQGHDIKLLIVACNTASAYAVETLRAELDLPVLGVIMPGAAAAAKATRSGRIGVIGTAGTVGSGMYPRAIAAVRPDAKVVCRACPLFVPLAEEGWTQGVVPREVARTYLGGLLTAGVDTLVLGCTHYPLLTTVIAEVAGGGVTLVDSAQETARVVAHTLAEAGLQAPDGAPVRRSFLVTDAPAAFVRIGRRFLGYDIGDVRWVDC
ncbi:MAG: glutamate racemase [Candidatus Hydrogenedentota bacterium]